MKRTPLRRVNPERRARLRAAQFGPQAQRCRESGCLVCGAWAEPHHVRSRGAGGTDADCVPLCRAHHDEIHRRGPVWFQVEYDIDLDAAAKRMRGETLAAACTISSEPVARTVVSATAAYARWAAAKGVSVEAMSREKQAEAFRQEALIQIRGAEARERLSEQGRMSRKVAIEQVKDLIRRGRLTLRPSTTPPCPIASDPIEDAFTYAFRCLLDTTKPKSEP